MSAPQRVAAVDIGTNTVRLLIADVTSSAVVWRTRTSRVVRLGQDVDATGALAPAAIDRAIAALTRYGELIRADGCVRVRSVATSAVRDARNREIFLERAEAALGTLPETISGDAEAALSFAGTTLGVERDRPFLVIDPGGGSTEFVLGAEEPSYAVSVDIGSVRLTERAFATHPPTMAELDAARGAVDDLVAAQVALSETPHTVFGVGGTYTSLVGIFLGLETYDPDVVHGSVLTAVDLHDLVDRLATLTLEQTGELPSLDPKRAAVILGGAVVAERALIGIGRDEIIVSERDILDGIALGLATD